MGLVSQAAFCRDVTQRLIGREHESLRPLHATADDVLARRLADAVAECKGKVGRAEPSDIREIFVSHRRAEVRFDMGEHSAKLPRRKALPYYLFRRPR